MKSLALALLLIATSCLRVGTSECSRDADCFVGEVCEAARCAVAVPTSNNSTSGPSCDLSACVSDWTDEVACRGAACIVLSCAEGADLCADGCCEVTLPPDGEVPLAGYDARLVDVELDPRGFPELVWLDFSTIDVFLTRWTGRGWETEQITALPEPSLAFDLEYDGDVRTLTYLETLEGALYHARQEPDGAWMSTKVMDPPEPLTASPDARFFFRTHYASGGNTRVICALFGTVADAESLEPDGEMPDLYVAHWEVDHWKSEPLETTDSVRRWCSVAVDPLGQAHVAYSAVEGGTAFVRHAYRPLVGGGWERSNDSSRVGLITNNEALQIVNNEAHIFAAAGDRNQDDELVAAIFDYYRAQDGTWAEQRVHALSNPELSMGISDVAFAQGRVELLIAYYDPTQGVLLGGRITSTQPRTWGTLELFLDEGYISDLNAAASGSHLHVFLQPTAQPRPWNYFSLEAP